MSEQGYREAVTRTLAATLERHAVEWIDDSEAFAPGFYECGCNEDGHMNRLLLTPADVARHRAEAASDVLVSLRDDRLAEAEAKVERVEAAMALFEKDAANVGVPWVSTTLRALRRFRAALSGDGQEATR